MKEKNADVPNDVMDYILPTNSHERVRQQPIRYSELTEPTASSTPTDNPYSLAVPLVIASTILFVGSENEE